MYRFKWWYFSGWEKWSDCKKRGWLLPHTITVRVIMGLAKPNFEILLRKTLRPKFFFLSLCVQRNSHCNNLVSPQSLTGICWDLGTLLPCVTEFWFFLKVAWAHYTFNKLFWPATSPQFSAVTKCCFALASADRGNQPTHITQLTNPMKQLSVALQSR